MSSAASVQLEDLNARIADVLQQYWGFDALRPLQDQAIHAGVAQRDSLVVLPTGGGKSLCYQIPPLLDDSLDIVVCPLIALMKDQVDGLAQNGYPAAALHSHLTPDQRREVHQGIDANAYRLLFVTPERLLTPQFLEFLKQRRVRRIAIDEAHCISQWGHDFRPEYRRLAELKQHLPEVSLHAYTATATTRVQHDIVAQLGLREPRLIVGRFDRPNLLYRILPAGQIERQVLEACQRHPDEAVIVYCISRRDTESLAEFLKGHGIAAAAYHAGLDADQRTATQEAFANEQLDVVVATVAFGMGIDRSNVRCIVHAAMPKSIEHYQQETGRAGRDGLEAECLLLYAPGDAHRWESLLRKSAEEAAEPQQLIEAQLELLHQMQNYCRTLHCRHRALSRHFGQDYEHENCEACDVCLGEVQAMPDSTTVARKILSCVYRLGRPFGARHIAQVLRGANTDAIRTRQHDQLSTYGLMPEWSEKPLAQLVYQLLDHGLLQRTDPEFPTLQLTAEAGPVLRGERDVMLTDPRQQKRSKTRADEVNWEGVDHGLFDRLRQLRREFALERGVPPYVIFNDATLRTLARVRPTTPQAMQGIRGIGQRKLEDLGQPFADAIAQYCHDNDLTADRGRTPEPDAAPAPPRRPKPNTAKEHAMTMFAQGQPVEEVVQAIRRAPRTVWGYLEEFVEKDPPDSLAAWGVDEATYQRVVDTAAELAAERLKPIHDHLDGEVSYEVIRLVLAHHRATHETD